MRNFAIYKSQFGFIRLEYQADKIYYIKREHSDKIEDFGKKNNFTDEVYQELSEYFAGQRKEFSFAYELVGTDFQKKVWQALCNIPYGETRSYQDIAIAIGNEKACRAVGLANNKNPISIAVPCHRVIGKNGSLVGYAGGLEMKQYLLKLEKNNL